MNKKLSFVFLNFHSCDLILERIKELTKLDGLVDYMVVVVDNGEDSKDYFQNTLARFSSVTYIDALGNIGYARGNNLGIYHSYVEGADFVFVSNPDVEFSHVDIIIEAERLSKPTPSNVAVYSYKIDGLAQYVTKSNIFNTLFPYLKRRADCRIDCPSGTRLDRFHGCFFSISRDYLNLNGGKFFDEGTFLYFEEDISSQDIHSKHFLIIGENSLTVKHYGSLVVNSKIPIKKYFFQYQSLKYLLNRKSGVFKYPYPVAAVLAFISIGFRVLVDRVRSF